MHIQKDGVTGNLVFVCFTLFRLPQNLNRNLLENTGITLGRVGLICPDLVAPRMQDFIQPWCFNLRNIRNDIEKEHAFQGL